MMRTQRGNVFFPIWEYFVPKVGIISSQGGNAEHRAEGCSVLNKLTVFVSYS